MIDVGKKTLYCKSPESQVGGVGFTFPPTCGVFARFQNQILMQLKGEKILGCVDRVLKGNINLLFARDMNQQSIRPYDLEKIFYFITRKFRRC